MRIELGNRIGIGIEFGIVVGGVIGIGVEIEIGIGLVLGMGGGGWLPGSRAV